MKYFYPKIIILIFIFAIVLSGQQLIFSKERIELQIYRDSCFLTGKYYFKNVGNVPIDKMIYYPISKKFNLSKPDSIRVSDLSNSKIIPHSYYKDGFSFNLIIPAMDQVMYEVQYFQKAPDQKMEYILSSTKNWNRPLESAEFIIKLFSGLNLKSMSMKYDYKKVRENYTSYFISKHHFMPDSNLTIEWR